MYGNNVFLPVLHHTRPYFGRGMRGVSPKDRCTRKKKHPNKKPIELTGKYPLHRLAPLKRNGCGREIRDPHGRPPASTSSPRSKPCFSNASFRFWLSYGSFVYNQ